MRVLPFGSTPHRGMLQARQSIMHTRSMIGTWRDLAIAMACAAIALTAHAQSPAPAKLANPASENCVAKGGKLSLEKNPRGGQFGVCTFADDLQCEEWAMLRNECRTGGIKVTGYVTPAARYCAITGGTYTAVAASNTSTERGNCTFSNGRKCSAASYFNGTCTRDSTAPAKSTAPAATPAAATRIVARFTCAAGKSIDATFINARSNSVQLVLSDQRKMTLPQSVSGSGARYANSAETIVFWNKGNTAFLQERGKTTYADCVTKP